MQSAVSIIHATRLLERDDQGREMCTGVAMGTYSPKPADIPTGTGKSFKSFRPAVMAGKTSRGHGSEC